MHTIDASDRTASRAGQALVAIRANVSKVRAACPLQQITADRGHVPQLWRRTLQQCLGYDRIFGQDTRMGGDVGHAGERTDHQSLGCYAYLMKRQRIDIDQPSWLLDALPHQVNQRSATGNEAPAPASGDSRLDLTGGFLVSERNQWILRSNLRGLRDRCRKRFDRACSSRTGRHHVLPAEVDAVCCTSQGPQSW
jgi:hypothetical protein